MKKVIFIICLIFPISCTSLLINKAKPANLQECYIKLDKMFSAEEKDIIMKSNDSGMMIKYHMSIGMFIRNNWIRNGNYTLEKQINYKPWKVGIDDIGGVILDGYWHYLHKQEYNWDATLNSAERYYASYEEPAAREYPDNFDLKLQNNKPFLDGPDFTEVLHVYKDLKSNNYYVYSHTYGWIKLDDSQYQIFSKTRDRMRFFSPKQ
jgi:hypothetical protein